MHSALTATLCVGGLRNARRRGASLLDQAQAANEAVIESASAGSLFATGPVGRLDLQTGILDVVNAGHPAPLLVREGLTQPVVLPVNRPFGVVAHKSFRTAQLQLRPGDRLVLLTDGMLERGAAAIDLAARLQDLTRLHPREVVRVLGDVVLEMAGPALPDDACLLVLDWYGGHGDTRSTTAGADPSRASAPAADRGRPARGAAQELL